jgi:hypothetical protein
MFGILANYLIIDVEYFEAKFIEHHRVVSRVVGELTKRMHAHCQIIIVEDVDRLPLIYIGTKVHCCGSFGRNCVSTSCGYR